MTSKMEKMTDMRSGSIRLAGEDEFETARAFYHRITDALADTPYGPGWKKDIYPDPQMLKEALAKGQLYLLEIDGKTEGAMIVNSDTNEAYETFCWQHSWRPDEVLVIHALGVHPSVGRKGYAKQMVRFVLTMAAQQQKKAVRLDVLKGNVPAEHLYPGLGFVYEGELPMYYEDTGETMYELYEYTL